MLYFFKNNGDMINIYLLLLITVAVVIAGYFGFRLLRNLVSRPILEISLSPIDHPKWRDTAKITDLIYAFQQKGFESAGDYECPEIPSLIISGFVHPSEQMAGVIYDHPTLGIWVDIGVHYNDGGSLTVSNAPIGHELDHMPQQTKFYSKGSSFNELFEKFLTESREAGRIAITKEKFVPEFIAQYQKEMRWRKDRGGPTYLEVRRVAEEMGGSTAREKLENATHKLQKSWMSAKEKPIKIRNDVDTTGLPGEFQRPEEFRRKMEQKSGPPPRLGVSALPVYLVLFSAMIYWCYYGWQYNKTHFPVSLTAIVVFFGVFLLPFLITMYFRAFNRRVKIYPVLKRMAGMKPGAFLVVEGTSPALFYARETWIGKVFFEEGSENQNAFTRLDARIRQPVNQLEIYKKSLLDKFSGRPEKDIIELPESDFSRKFTVSGTEAEFAKKFLNPAVSGAIMRLAEFGDPVVDINSNAVRIEIGRDLSSPRKETALRQFLDNAETIIEKAAQETLIEIFEKE
jgi:hypothetical protein